MKNKAGNLLSWVASSAVLIGIDQYTKALAVARLKNQQPFVILDGVFEFLYSENRGAAFGLMPGTSGLFLPDWNCGSGCGRIRHASDAGMAGKEISLAEALCDYDYSWCSRKYD